MEIDHDCGKLILDYRVSCHLRVGLIDSRLRLEPDVSLFPAGFFLVRPANGAHISSTRPRIGSVAFLIPSSTYHRVSSSANVAVTGVSISGSCLNHSSTV